MSTGVFRQYPHPRQQAPRVIIGQPLDAPIAPLAQRPQVREANYARLAPLGIAALLPVAAAYVPPAPIVMPARAAYFAQQPAPDLVAAFLSPSVTDTPIPFTPPLIVPRASYPVQMPAPGISALIPQVQTYVAPAPIAMIARAAPAPVQPAPEQIAPFVTSSTTDAPIGYSIVMVARAAPPAVLQPTPGIAPLIPASVQYVPPAALPRLPIATRFFSAASLPVPPAAPTTYVPKWSAPQFARQPYQVQQIRAWLVQGAVAPVVLGPISGQTAHVAGLGSVTVFGPSSTTVNGPASATVNGPASGTVNGPDGVTVFG